MATLMATSEISISQESRHVEISRLTSTVMFLMQARAVDAEKEVVGPGKIVGEQPRRHRAAGAMEKAQAIPKQEEADHVAQQEQHEQPGAGGDQEIAGLDQAEGRAHLAEPLALRQRFGIGDGCDEAGDAADRRHLDARHDQGREQQECGAPAFAGLRAARKCA